MLNFSVDNNCNKTLKKIFIVLYLLEIMLLRGGSSELIAFNYSYSNSVVRGKKEENGAEEIN